MRTVCLALATLLTISSAPLSAQSTSARAPAATQAQPATMRVDYYHTGNDKEERFSLDRVVIEPLSWAGNTARPVDTTDSGKYFFEIADEASGAVLYSRGFNSIYGEWETTAEAQKMNRTFSESFRFPAPQQPARVTLKKRDRQNQFKPSGPFRSIRPTSSSNAACGRRPAGCCGFMSPATPRRNWIC
jgi:hypothetical protein